MSTDYRIDITRDVITYMPVGMNSIYYLGGSLREARKEYQKAIATRPGNFITLFKWSKSKYEWEILEQTSN